MYAESLTRTSWGQALTIKIQIKLNKIQVTLVALYLEVHVVAALTTACITCVCMALYKVSVTCMFK